SPQLLYGEPDLTLKVVRDLFTEDFTKLVVQGDDAWDLVDNYVQHVAPDLQDRLECFRPEEDGNGTDLFATYRLDEQIAKGLDRKVWLPSGGSLIIDRTEAMTVVDVNTGKFTGSGGNLEETVTKNNLEAAEEMVRQLRLRDIGGIIVIDFIDMVLESNRDLVLRRMVECLGRDRTRHQVAEVTSLGLVQMTRKRIGTGLLEAFSEECEHCKGRGLVTHDHPIEQSNKPDDDLRRGGRRSRGGRAKSGNDPGNGSGSGNGSGNGNRSGNASTPSPKDVAAVARPENADRPPLDEQDEPDQAERDQLTPDSAEDSSVESPVTADSASETVDGNGLDTDTDTSPAEETPAGAGPEPEPTPSEPAPPTVVTTRRRSSRRAAGPPIVSPAEASGSDDGLPKGAHFASSDAAAAQGDGAGPDTSLRIESGDEPDDGEDGAFVLHVPVKRKGSRKR
ncbi:MAG: ribonuclease E/G, partial [Marmoricola sp.]